MISARFAGVCVGGGGNPHLNVQTVIILTKCYNNIVLPPLWFHHKSTTDYDYMIIS